MKLALIAIAALCAAQPSFAQGTNSRPASEAEFAKVKEELAKIGCEPKEVERESDHVFDIEDAQCTIGQFDIKVGNDFKVISLTSDE